MSLNCLELCLFSRGVTSSFRVSPGVSLRVFETVFNHGFFLGVTHHPFTLFLGVSPHVFKTVLSYVYFLGVSLRLFVFRLGCHLMLF